MKQARFTIVGLWGKYIFKPQSAQYRCLPELENVTMKMVSAAGIRTVVEEQQAFQEPHLTLHEVAAGFGSRPSYYAVKAKLKTS